MAKKRIRKNHVWEQAKWEEIAVEEENNNNQQQYKKEWEYVNWEKDQEIEGYYIGIRKTKNGKILGLLLKQPPYNEDEPPCLAFSIPTDLKFRLEALEKRGRILHGVRIILTDVIQLDDNRRKYVFKVQSSSELRIDEDVIMQYLSFTPEKLTGGSVI